VFFLFLVVFLIVGGALTVVTVQNLSTPVQLILFGWQTPVIPVGLLVFLAFLLGALLLYLVAFLAARHDRREIKQLRQRVKELEHEKQQVAYNVPPINMMQPQPGPPIMRMPGMSGPLPN
jgi:uncharacterized integral membrane protein